MNSKARKNVCIAWHGLPFYAYQSINALWQDDSFALQVVGSEAKGMVKGSAQTDAFPIVWADNNRPASFADLSLRVPDILFKTSWHHPLFEAMADQVRAHGGKVVALVDNTFSFRPRKLAGVLAGRLTISRKNHGVWVPGKCAFRYMRLMGFRSKHIFQGLYCTSEREFVASGGARPSRALFVGRFEPEKNIASLLAGWRAYKRRGGRLEELLLVGSGSIQVCEDAAVGIRVRDWATQKEVASLMSTSECFVLPSLCDHWGVVLLEAALCGAILVSNGCCGAAHDLIEQDANGVMATGTSADAICSGFLRYDERFSAMSAKAAAGALSRRLGLRYSTQRFVETAKRAVNVLGA